jgi:hypothetical protein
MLKSERSPCDREEREGYPFNDIGKLNLPQNLLYGHRGWPVSILGSQLPQMAQGAHQKRPSTAFHFLSAIGSPMAFIV